MKKRELLIVLAFVTAGLIAYQLSARPPEDDTPGFSLRAALDSVRREVSRNAASAAFKHDGRIEIAAGLELVRISGISRIQITGEARDDIAYELEVESSGSDERAALAMARQTTLQQDDLGRVLALRALAPAAGGRHSARLVLRVPPRLAAHIEGLQGGTTIEVLNIAAVQLDAGGDARLGGIVGAVTGSHRNGDLVVAGAGAVDLTLVGVDAALSRVSGAIALNARNGRCRLERPAGPVELDQSNQETIIVGSQAPVRVRGTGGSVRVDHPRADVTLDLRRASIEITLDAPVAVTALTMEAPLHLVLEGPPPVLIDAVASDGGTVRSAEFALTPDTYGQESRLHHSFAPNGARVALRNRRNEIVIRPRK